jgi:DNA-binding transcriptional MerR regulator
MKTGAVAKRFDVDPNTITAWTDRFADFFSSEALAKDKRQRDYQPEDIIVLNTIRVARNTNKNWNEILTILESGDRDETLPPEFTSIDGTKAITVYTEMRELRAQLSNANAEVERLRGELATERKDKETIIREAARWQARYEMLKEIMEEKEKPSDAQ